MVSPASSWAEPTFMKQRTKEIVLVSYKDAHRCPRAHILPSTIWVGRFPKRCTIAQGGVRDAPPCAPLVDVAEVPGGGSIMGVCVRCVADLALTGTVKCRARV
eukprot:scaffold60_cov325-Pavlova_lutheri.AAC.16